MRARNALVGLGLFAIVGFGAPPKVRTVNGIMWHDSFTEAQVLSKRTGKPILLLSMFGDIDEDMPCANARTLRATLFKSESFRRLTAESVIPVWEKVRAVPKVYIDLGDGKRLVRTVRGNAVMYLCNSEGRVVDALPGVYTEADFVREIHQTLDDLAAKSEEAILAGHRAFPPPPRRRTLATFGKGVLESPTLNVIGAPKITGFVSPPSEKGASPARQRFLAAASDIEDLSLTPASVTAVTRRVVGPETAKTGEDLSMTILANDSANNVRTVRPVIHLYFASLDHLPTPAEARDAILEDVLKIPYKDPYFGLREVLLPGTP